METGVGYEREGKKYKVKHVVPSQNMFRCMTSNATAIGMKVNNSKTRLICISDSLASLSKGCILDGGGERINQSEDMKLLRFHLSSRPTVSAHIRVLLRRMRMRLWVLRHLREAGFSQEELVKTYKVIIRPVHDYMSVVYHPMMTDEHDEQVERIQSQALKSIFGWKIPYVELRARADLTTLR